DIEIGPPDESGVVDPGIRLESLFLQHPLHQRVHFRSGFGYVELRTFFGRCRDQRTQWKQNRELNDEQERERFHQGWIQGEYTEAPEMLHFLINTMTPSPSSPKELPPLGDPGIRLPGLSHGFNHL